MNTKQIEYFLAVAEELSFTRAAEKMYVSQTAVTQQIQSLEELMGTLYPKMVRENLGVFSYYIGFFYSLITILVCNNIIPRERKKGKWILPIEQGYNGRDFLIGKCVVYGCLAGISVFLSYMVYYFIANTFMELNCSWK